jgi:ABC-type Fe3+-hydroxamate transport system substrate-binding protein
VRHVLDDRSTLVQINDVVRRVVSLVPSLTEAIAVSAPDILVGATDWCTHPADLDVTRVRGTKNPDLAAIVALAPDLVICNQEENRRLDVDRLRAQGIAVWVTVIETVDQSLDSLDRLFTTALAMARPAWLDAACQVWAAPPPAERRTAAIAVWRDPWMVVGSSTFTGDLLARMGIDNVFTSAPDRYPHVTIDDIVAAEPDLMILPDEPYVFTASDGPEVFPGLRCALVEGRALTWYGPSMVDARGLLTRQLQ